MGLQFQLLYKEFDSNTESMQQKVVSAICMDMFPKCISDRGSTRTRVLRLACDFQC